MNKKYFCDYCGYIFTSNLKNFDLYCKKCGSYCIYEYNKEEANKSIERLNK